MRCQRRLAALLAALLIAYVSGRGKSTPNQRVSRNAKSSDFLLDGGSDSGGAFKKVTSRKGVTEWAKTVNGIPVYGSVLTTHEDMQGNIKAVQGFASRSVGRVNTKPKISKEEAVGLLKEQWNHTSAVTNVTVRLDDPEPQVLDNGERFARLVYNIAYFIAWSTD